jgi:hypothetical protein
MDEAMPIENGTRSIGASKNPLRKAGMPLDSVPLDFHGRRELFGERDSSNCGVNHLDRGGVASDPRVR